MQLDASALRKEAATMQLSIIQSDTFLSVGTDRTVGIERERERKNKIKKSALKCMSLLRYERRVFRLPDSSSMQVCSNNKKANKLFI